MEQVFLKDCRFHDSTISNVSFDGKKLVLYMTNAAFKEGRSDLKVEIQVEDSGLVLYKVKQYCSRHKVKLKGKEISIKELEAFFSKGCTLEVVEFVASVDSNLLVIECDSFPYPKKRGTYNKVILKIDYACDYLVVKNEGH